MVRPWIFKMIKTCKSYQVSKPALFVNSAGLYRLQAMDCVHAYSAKILKALWLPWESNIHCIYKPNFGASMLTCRVGGNTMYICRQR